MTDKDKTEEVTDAEAGAETIKDEALDQAEGGFSLSGSFSSTLNTTTVNQKFTDVNFNTATGDLTTDTVDNVAALRRRPGRI